LDPALQSALSKPSVLLFGAIKIELPGYTLRLLDGAGSLVVNGETYVGLDETFGSLAGMSELSEELGDGAPEVTVTLNPPGLSAAAVLAHPGMQGGRAQIIVGAADPVSGVSIGTPEVLFLGEIDVPTINLDPNGARTVEFTIVSVFERLFEVEEGQRASNGWHQSICPGELGLEFMTGTDVNLYWGVKAPSGITAKGSGVVGGYSAASRAETA
jgi:hypothetical protein